jgi:pimeloyl-ACP methyl ester carboxylesterase
MVNVNDVNLYYQVHGDGDPLILIQGYGGGHEGWFFQVRSFKRRFRTIMFDNRGIGKSELPAQRYDLSTLADDTVGLMDYLKIERAHILGMSLGGMVAQEIAIRRPERVKGLILACTSFGEGEGAEAHPDLLQALGVTADYARMNLEKVDFRKAMETVINLSFNSRLYKTILIPLAKSYMKPAKVKGHFAQMQAVDGYSSLDHLHLIKAPTLVLTGTDDRIVPPRLSEIIAEKISGAILVKIPAGSHALNIEKRNEFNNEVLRFLSSIE